MKSVFISMTIILLFFTVQQGFCVSSADTLRNEKGEIIPSPSMGQAGVDYVAQQFIASLKPGYLTLPSGSTEANLSACTVNKSLKTILTQNNVNYVKQVFTGATLGDTLRVVGSDTCYVPDLSQIFIFYQSTSSGVSTAINAMYTHAATLYAEPNYILNLTATPNDTYWGYHWNLDNTSPGIGCETAWNGTVGSSSIRIGVIDSGIDYNHTDLGGPGFPNDKIGGGYDFADNDSDPLGDYYHGTCCAGIIGALSNNSNYVAGIAGGWNQNQNDVGCKLFAIKAAHNGEDDIQVSSAAAGICYAVGLNVGCTILNNSYGDYDYSETLRSAINFAYRVGASFIAGKGNDGNDDPFYPSDYDYSWVTSVASYGRDGLYCQQSNCQYESNYGCGIDITAPGIDIPTTMLDNSYTLYFRGTSAACPQVAGAVGLIRSEMSGLRNEDTEWMLKYSSYDPSPDHNVWTWHERYGHGDLRISTTMNRIDGIYSWPYDFSTYTATGGFEASHTGYETYRFFGGPLVRTYYVRRYDVRVNVTYPENYESLPFVWGVGYNSIGWSGANPNYQVGYASLVEGTQTSTGCQLQTFVYDVYNNLGQHVGWYPCEVDEVSLQYRVWGIISSITPTSFDLSKSSTDEIPENVTLSSIYPNPFNSTTLIEFTLTQEQPLTVNIYDLLGRKVRTLYEGTLSQGNHRISWNGTNGQGDDIPSGVYFCIIKADGIVAKQKITMLR